MTINPKVIDISHYDAVVGDGFNAVRHAGIVGVVHKSSEGMSSVDGRYATRRDGAKAAGLEWGAYHFLRPGNMKAQADFFMKAAKPDDTTMISCDYEVDNVSAGSAREFIEAVEKHLGRKVVLYSGNTIKDKLGFHIDPWWGARRLWLAQYSSKWVVQRSWHHPWLWQYTGDGVGQKPHVIPGIQIAGGLDISSYDGTDEALRAEWASNPDHETIIPEPMPEFIPPSVPRTFHGITMTEFGGPDDPQTSAYGGGKVRGDVPGVALPYRFHGKRPTVKITANGKSVVAPVVDVGPWFTDDPWFSHDGRPRAEQVARTNHAGIDATPAVWAALGLRGKGMAKVQVEVLGGI